MYTHVVRDDGARPFKIFRRRIGYGEVVLVPLLADWKYNCFITLSLAVGISFYTEKWYRSCIIIFWNLLVITVRFSELHDD